MKAESQYSKAKKESMVYAFSISIIICIPLSYVSIEVWWGKLMFEMATKTALLFFSWKGIYEWILKYKVKRWEKNNKNLVLKGNWYVVHYSDEKNFKSYLRYGKVKLEQTMDKYFFKEGRNYSRAVKNDKIGKPVLKDKQKREEATWASFGKYIYSETHKVLSGTFDVDREKGGKTDGMHFLTVESCDKMTGHFFNVNSKVPNKPKKGLIELFKNKDTAKNRYIELYNERKKK